MITDCFGREYASLDEFTAPPRGNAEPVYAGHGGALVYVGTLFEYPGIGWTHSHQRFGTEPFATRADALADLIASPAEDIEVLRLQSRVDPARRRRGPGL